MELKQLPNHYNTEMFAIKCPFCHDEIVEHPELLTGDILQNLITDEVYITYKVSDSEQIISYKSPNGFDLYIKHTPDHKFYAYYKLMDGTIVNIDNPVEVA